MLTTPPLALYIHFPWCIRKCPYCDFNSHTLRADLPEETYIDRLITDLEQDSQRIANLANRPITSIFMGGGTPSLFSPQALARLLNFIQQRLKLDQNIEITLEANPGTVEYQRFADYKAAGINRLSIGIQSFQADKLTALGRIHNDKEAVRAAETAHAVGITNFNLDLMHGLPKQTFEDALYDLKTGISLAPTHLSWYQLTLEPNTFFAHNPPPLPHDELIWDMQEAGRDLLAQHGFPQYEISAYSKADRLCLHNKNYWQFGDYLGIGAGAHSKITDIASQTVTRFWKVKNPKDYLNPEVNLIGAEQNINSKELPFEFMLNHLRLYQDIPVSLFHERTGLPISTIAELLDRAQTKGLLLWEPEWIRPTNLGRQFYNDLVEIFIT